VGTSVQDFPMLENDLFYDKFFKESEIGSDRI
jgi:hypothetical protein